MNFFNIDLNTLELSKIGSWPANIRKLIILVMTALSILWGILYHIMPKMDYYESEKKKRFDLAVLFEKYYEQSTHLAEYKQQLLTVKENLDEVLNQFPARSFTAELLEELSLNASSAGLIFHSIKPLQEQTEDFYKSLPIQLSLSGGYHSLGIFLESVASMSRIITMHDFVFKRDPENPAFLSISILFQSYWSDFL